MCVISLLDSDVIESKVILTIFFIDKSLRMVQFAALYKRIREMKE